MSDELEEVKFKCDHCGGLFDPEPAAILETHAVYRAGDYFEASLEPDGAICICLACQAKWELEN